MGVPRAKLLPIVDRVELRTFETVDGKQLLDLPRAPLPPEDTPAPPRFLGTSDAALLVHARRTQILPERFRPLVFHTKNPQSVATFLVDGAVAGAWRVERTGAKAMLRLDPFEPLPRGARRRSATKGPARPARRAGRDVVRRALEVPLFAPPSREERQLWLALAAEHLEVDLDAAEPSRLAER